MIGKVEVWLHLYSPPLLFSPSPLLYCPFLVAPLKQFIFRTLQSEKHLAFKKIKQNDPRFMCQNQQSASLMRLRSKVTFEPVTKEVTG